MLERLFRKKELPFADLQVHSYFSDGHVSPERLLAHADELGLRVIAVTDHDSLDGTRAALEAASQFEVDVVPALELTTWWDTPQGSGEIDILGYFVDADDATLKETTHQAMDDIRSKWPNQVVGIVAHRIPIALLKMRYQGLDPDIIRTLDLPNTYYETIDLPASSTPIK